MGLATPTSIMVGTGRAAEMGVLFRKGDALQLLAGVDVIAFDKTGTLTRGAPVLTDLDVADGFERHTALQVMASVEQGSDHPIARAIVVAANEDSLDLLPIKGGQTYAGLGLSAHVSGKEVILGTERLMQERGIDVSGYHASAKALASQGKSVIFAARAGHVMALAGVSDALKPSTPDAIARLKAAGITVVMLTGDRRDAAQQIGADLGMDQVHAELHPADKSRLLKELKMHARQLAFVGDGINDAPALAAADIGIALGTGTDVALESADVVLMSGDLLGVVNAIEMSRLTLGNIKQNLFWAFGYNVALIPVAAGALYPGFGMLLSPILAATAMALSSIFVLANALRLRYVRAAR
jgi:heavy metal translocating P-type ATPase